MTPNLETHVEIKAQAQALKVMEERGTASSHLEVLSIIFRRYLNPRRAMAPPDPDAFGKIVTLEQESLERRISHGTGSYSADTGARTLSSGQHPWLGRTTQTWRTRAS